MGFLNLWPTDICVPSEDKLSASKKNWRRFKKSCHSNSYHPLSTRKIQPLYPTAKRARRAQQDFKSLARKTRNSKGRSKRPRDKEVNQLSSVKRYTLKVPVYRDQIHQSNKFHCRWKSCLLLCWREWRHIWASEHFRYRRPNWFG